MRVLNSVYRKLSDQYIMQYRYHICSAVFSMNNITQC